VLGRLATAFFGLVREPERILRLLHHDDPVNGSMEIPVCNL